MAEVTGDIGGQSVQLNNAATEATLKQLLAVAQAQLAAQGKKGADLAKLQADLDKRLKSMATEAKKAADAIDKEKKARQDNTDAVEDNTDAVEDETKARERAAQSLKNFSSNVGKGLNLLKGAIDLVVNTASTLSNMGNSMSSAAQAFEVIPGAGAQLAKTFGAVGAAAEKTYKSFQTASSVGANFNGSISTMVKAATDAGLTFDDFSGLISQNAENLRFLGGTTAEGAKRLAELSKDVRKSQLGRDLAGLGFTTAETAEGIARMAAMQRRSGNREELNREQLISQTGSYLKNLDAVSKLTGKTKDALQKEADARMRDAQYRVAERRIIKEDRGNLNNFMDSLGDKALQDAFKEMQATGTLAGDASQKLMRVSPEVAQAMLQTARASRESGRFTQEMADQTEKAMISAARRDEQQGRLTVQAAHNAAEVGEAAVAVMDLAARGSTTAEERAKSEMTAAELQKKRDAGMAEATDPAAMKAFQEQVASVSNQFTLVLAEGLPKFQEAFTQLTGVITGPLETAFDTFIDNLEIAAAALLALSALQAGSGMLGDRIGKKAAGKGARGGKGPKGPKGPPIGGAAGEVAEKATKEAAEKITKEAAEKAGGKAMIKGAAKIGLKAVPVLGTAYAVVDSALAAYEAAKDAENVLGIKGREATAGETAAAATGGVVDALTFGLVSKESVAQGMANWFGLGPSQQADAAKEATEKAAEETKKNTDATKKAAEENKKSTEATKENTAATKEVAKEATAKKPSEPNWMDPASTLKYYKELQTSPGASVSATVKPSGPPAKAMPIGEMQKGLQAELAAKGITDPTAVANIMAQVQAESGFKPQSENLNYSGKKLFELYGAGNAGGNKARFKTLEEAEALAAKGPEAVGNVIYGGRMGNSEDEGFKYRGRGMIQLTGKNNYEKFGKMIGVDLVSNPDLANDPAVAQKIAAAYFAEKQKKGVDLTNIASVGKSVGYAGGAAETAKRAQLAAGFQTQLASATPTSAGEMMKALYTPEAPKTAPVAAASSAVPAASTAASQDTPANLLASLNTKLDTLIALQSKQNMISEKGNKITRSMTGDLYA